MLTKYFLQIEIRWTEQIERDGELITSSKSKNIHSETFDNINECIVYGNKIIDKNKWVEQYPGYVGQRLNIRFGSPLCMFSLKNRSDIFISVCTLNIYDFGDTCHELQQFKKVKL